MCGKKKAMKPTLLQWAPLTSTSTIHGYEMHSPVVHVLHRRKFYLILLVLAAQLAHAALHVRQVLHLLGAAPE